MSTPFTTKVETLARKHRPRIAFGLQEPDKEILESLERMQTYADLVVVGSEAIKTIPLEKVISDAPEQYLVEMLIKKEVDGIVRGTLDDFKTVETYKKLTGENAEGSTCLFADPSGREFFMSPVSNPDGWTKEGRAKAAKELALFAQEWDIPARIAVYAGTRHETYARKKDVREGVVGILNNTYEDAEWIVAELTKEGLEAKNWAIDFDLAVNEGFTIHIPVNGMVGNQMLRVLFSCGGKLLLGTRLGFSRPYEDNSRNERNFDLHIKWLCAVINRRGTN